MKMSCAWFVQCPEQVTSLDKNSYQHHQNLPISYNLPRPAQLWKILCYETD